MAEGVTFYDGAESVGSPTEGLTPAAPSKSGGPVEFFKGAEDVSGFSVPTNPSNGEGMPKGGASLIEGPNVDA